MKALAVALLAALIAAAAILPSSASTDGGSRSFVYTANKSDAWVWVTSYGWKTGEHTMQAYDGRFAHGAGPGEVAPGPIGNIVGAWCVGPGASDKHGLKAAVYVVRFEVTGPNCAHPVALDKSLMFAGADITGRPQTAAKPGIATLTGGEGLYALTEVQGASQ